MFDRILCKVFKKKEITLGDVVAPIVQVPVIVLGCTVMFILFGYNTLLFANKFGLIHTQIMPTLYWLATMWVIGGVLTYFGTKAIGFLTIHIIGPIMNKKIAECPLNKNK